MDTDREQPGGDDRSGSLADALGEYLAAIGAGSPPDRAAWLASHPELGQDLADLLADLHQLGSIAAATPVAEGPAPRPDGDPGPSPLTTAFAKPPRPAPPSGSGSAPGPGSDQGGLVLGRYRVVRLLGRGGFGQVFLANDSELDRLVAVKLPTPIPIALPDVVDQFLAEARTLARLDHPNIVPIHDVGRTADGRCFIVSRYIKGMDLAVRIRMGRLLRDEAAALMQAVCEAAHHAHTHDLVHRDIKPSNILLDESGRPFLADFGLALRDDNYGRNVGNAGTPAYMSPEQARGEGHRVDGRSDVFSLGVVLYQLLVGRLPFRGETNSQLLEAIATCEPRPLRQVDDTVPRELERICLKALAKRASERYTTARDMAEDIRLYLDAAWQTDPTVFDPAPSPLPPAAAGSGEHSRPRRPIGGLSSLSQGGSFVSKGLRSFDEHDASFFLNLLPGAKNRDGLPENLSFWLSRIEAVDGDQTFRVGMIYGPSGCGKSSFVKAGLLPRLANHVAAVYVEAASGETENRLLRALRRACPALGDGLGLTAALAGLRRERTLGPGRKILIVVDQFEQWLRTYHGDETSELYAALRQCDGATVQAILLVRDDFWMTASRFMRDLDLELMSDRNMAAVDLFDRWHARKVLAQFGRGYHALPERSADLSKDQALFLDEAIDGLIRDDKVIPVRLAVFAEMIKSKPWTQATLKQVGGAEGLGVTFLEETFGTARANPRYGLHRAAAQAILQALLPPSIADIKGEPRTETDLRQVSGYAHRPREFEELVYILCVELRLISLADPGGGAPGAAAPAESAYQLTHDYLIRSIREWLDRRSRETWRGRSRALLADRAALWDRRRERRQLPSLPEYFYLGAGTPRRDRTPAQAAYLRAAGRHHAAWSTGLIAAALAVAALAWDAAGRLRARVGFNQLARASPAEAPTLIRGLAPLRRWVDPLLQAEADRHRRLGSQTPVGVSIALLPVDAGQVAPLRERMLRADPGEVRAIRAVLGPEGGHLGAASFERLRAGLWRDLIDANLGRSGTLRAACGLAAFAPDDPRWAAAAPEVVECLVASDLIEAGAWIGLLSPARRSLGPVLRKGFLDKLWPDARLEVAAAALAEYLGDDVAALVELAVAAAPPELAALLPALRKHPAAVPLLAAAFERERRAIPELSGNDRLLSLPARRAAAAATALVAFDQVAPLLVALRADPDPTLRTYLIHQLGQCRVDPRPLLTLIGRPDLETSVQQALILALGGYDPKSLLAADRSALARRLDALRIDHPDPGIHSAAEAVLRRLRPGEAWADRPAPGGPDGRRDWFVNGQGQTFAVCRGPFDFSFPSGKHSDNLEPFVVRIRRSFALATTEVTREQYRRVVGQEPEEWKAAEPGHAATGPLAANFVSYYDAARYCRRLSEQEMVPEGEMCYPPVAQIAPGMRLPADYLDRTGYRMPTDAEWIAGSQGPSRMRYPFGSDPTLAVLYARFLTNSNGRAGPVAQFLPNDVGLFDAIGNLYEWCEPYPKGTSVAADRPADVLAGDAEWVLHGGYFLTPVDRLIYYYRNLNDPERRMLAVGFRVARTCKERGR